MEHAENTLLLYEQLIDVEGRAAGITQAEASHDVLFVDLPETWVIVNAL